MDADLNRVWTSFDALAEGLQAAYSVTGKQDIRDAYRRQIRQYPLYMEWFDRIMEVMDRQQAPADVLEYGSGPGILAGKLASHRSVRTYTAVEPGPVFREMTAEEAGPDAVIIDGTAEAYVKEATADVAVATASYHHFWNKPLALANMRRNIRAGGMLIIADGFIPDYGFDDAYRPTDLAEFVDAVLSYASAQVLSMPSPSAFEVADQMRTAFLDILRIEELKVCLPILERQLVEAGFSEVRAERMRGDNATIDYTALGYCFVTARAHKHIKTHPLPERKCAAQKQSSRSRTTLS